MVFNTDPFCAKESKYKAGLLKVPEETHLNSLMAWIKATVSMLTPEDLKSYHNTIQIKMYIWS